MQNATQKSKQLSLGLQLGHKTAQLREHRLVFVEKTGKWHWRRYAGRTLRDGYTNLERMMWHIEREREAIAARAGEKQ